MSTNPGPLTALNPIYSSPTPGTVKTEQMTPDGLWIITTITTTAAAPPLAPVIPINAISSGILDNSPNWKAEKDGGTGGTAIGTSKYISAAMGRNFNATYTSKAGFRWSNSFGKSTTAKNYCYDLYFMTTDPSNIGQLELDMNQVMSDTRNVFACTQMDSNSGMWEYTLTPQGKCHWYPSKIPGNPLKLQANVWYHIRIFTHRDDAGVVYYDGVEVNNVYTAFDPSCKGVSAFTPNPPWPTGTQIINFQTDGSLNSGTMNCYGKQIQLIEW